MTFLDWLILLPIAGWFGYLIFRPKKKKGCSGNCSGCSCGCGK